MTEKKTYLGDGLYATHDGYELTLTAPREHGDHYVVLEPVVLDNLLVWLKQLGLLK